MVILCKFYAMIRKFIFTLTLLWLTSATLELKAQICKADTSLHKPGYKPEKLPNVKVDSNYNESISILVKRDTFKMVGAVKLNVKIDSVKATSVIGLPTGYNYECQHPSCVYLWDTVRCVRIFGSTNKSGIYPLKIPIIGYAKIGSSSLVQKDTIRDFTLIVDGDPARNVRIEKIKEWIVYPIPANHTISIYCDANSTHFVFEILNLNGVRQNILFQRINETYVASIAQLAPGVYFISGGNKIKKLIVEDN